MLLNMVLTKTLVSRQQSAQPLTRQPFGRPWCRIRGPGEPARPGMRYYPPWTGKKIRFLSVTKACKSRSRAESQTGGNNHRNSSQREASRRPNLCNDSKSVPNSGQRRAALARPWKRRQAARLLRPRPALAPPRVRRLSISAGTLHDTPNTFKTRTPRVYMIHQPHADLGRPGHP